MCSHSLYLRSARDVGASEGSVPVGSAQAVRDYVAYLQYSEFRRKLATELATLNAATPSETTRSPLPAVAALAGVPHAEHSVRGDGGGEVYDVAQSWLLPWDEDDVGHDGAYGYGVQPLDCDRAYACHASRPQNWFTAAELSSFRGRTLSEEEALTGMGDGRHGRSPVAATVSPMSATASAPMLPSSTAALPLSPLPPAVTLADAPESALHLHRSPQLLAAADSSLSSSSDSFSSSVSTASLEAYESAARATSGVGGGPHDRRQRKYLGEELGYGEFVALGDSEGLFFIEHVLLAHEPVRGATPAPTAGARWTDDASEKVTEGSEHGLTSQSSQGAHFAPAASQKATAATAATSEASFPSHTDPIVTLTVRQQCRLLELISVADFMGTQSLVELCATYLATWLMDHTDEEIVQSFLTTVGLSCAAAATEASVRVTGAASYNEPWIAAALRDDVAPEKSGRDANVSLPSVGVSSTSGVGKSRTETATTAAKKRHATITAAAPKHAGKQKGHRAASMDVTAAEPSNCDEGARASSTALTAGDPACAPLLLTGDQRLALLRQMKRDNSIIVSPY
ncbi:hypothetical protein NXY56_006241 [Leishmania guyanensis]